LIEYRPFWKLTQPGLQHGRLGGAAIGRSLGEEGAGQ
jgi:hypothetical protein